MLGFFEGGVLRHDEPPDQPADEPRFVPVIEVIFIRQPHGAVFEGSHDVPFDIKRIYYIHGAPKGTHRGGHAHKALRQVLWCPYGSIRIRLDNGREKADVLLDSPDKGLIVEHYMWREMIWEKKDSVLCVAADSYYDESDYIRDYDEFLEAVKGKDLD